MAMVVHCYAGNAARDAVRPFTTEAEPISKAINGDSALYSMEASASIRS